MWSNNVTPRSFENKIYDLIDNHRRLPNFVPYNQPLMIDIESSASTNVVSSNTNMRLLKLTIDCNGEMQQNGHMLSTFLFSEKSIGRPCTHDYVNQFINEFRTENDENINPHSPPSVTYAKPMKRNLVLTDTNQMSIKDIRSEKNIYSSQNSLDFIHLKPERAQLVNTPTIVTSGMAVLSSINDHNRHNTNKIIVSESINTNNKESLSLNNEEIDRFITCNKERFDRLKRRRKTQQHSSSSSTSSASSNRTAFTNPNYAYPSDCKLGSPTIQQDNVELLSSSIIV
ncbi:unnamed protein product [Didymodactylos carnosus]|uniref:Uncharacterized protein n=1 Tax=Didymodactylos carnosus TaxID=1234261 RepID=A0A813NGL0_9BILA|nr:unnamed protein product [Didymodactylos carnosus]CAF0739356.1 unnamed protein product [Didymodactylos carnosus]CAF3492440.1 unnamed protein product [Didymodactylos carnosus]CAF3517519.1 unnamed protein product [Didymodactylos carnosus]